MRILASLAALALTLSVAACSSSPDEATPTSTETATSSETNGANEGTPGTEMPTLDASGDQPILAFPDSNPPAGLQVEVLDKGTGREIAASDTVVAHYVGQVWGSSEPFDSSFRRGVPAAFSLTMVVKGWTQGLTGQTAGSKVILSIPPELGYGPSGGNAAAGIGESDTIAFYIELLDAYGVDQAGDADATMQVDPADLPVEITGGLGEPISVEVKDGAKEPTGEPVVTVIARGSGQPVGGAGTTIYDQFAMSFWDNSTSEKTYGTHGPQSQTLGTGSFFDALMGIPIGSRVLVEVPTSEGGDGHITAPAYAVVIDLLGQIEAEPNSVSPSDEESK